MKPQDIFDAPRFDESLSSTANTLVLFREALKKGRETLRAAFMEGARADIIVTRHAWLVDQLIVRAWQHHLPRLENPGTAALVAVGGYGRGELHPLSDVDIMVLLAPAPATDVNAFVEALIRFLWDMGLEVGHSMRTVKDCVRESKADITVATNLMEARLLHGDDNLFRAMQTATGPKKLWPANRFFTAKWQEQIARHHRFEDTAFNLEPNVKEGPGGLRDIQMITWVTKRHFGAQSLHELVDHDFLTEEEHRALIRGRNMLWHVRCALHYTANRREDRLLFDYQRELAAQAGLCDKPGSLAVEQYMKDYYRTIKELSLLNEILLQHFQEAILTRGKARVRNINRRYRVYGNFLETVNTRIYERAPWAMMELFLIMAQHPEIRGVRANTIRQLRAHLKLIDGHARQDIVFRSLFMEIVRQPQGVTHELRRMNAYGVLGAYLHAFGRIVGQMQHDLFHVYTVDEHILMVVRNLRRFTVPEYRHEFPLASALIQRVVKPERLILAALFHDIAKGRGGDHSSLGEQEVRRFAKLHDLSEYDTRFIAWLVRQHLLMSAVAQRQDTHDPEVVRRFAEQVGDQEHLDNLYLLTVADIRGTSPRVWNDWKGNLLAHLYGETTRVLRRGIGEPRDIDAHVADIRGETLGLIDDSTVEHWRVHRLWDQMEKDYFLRHNAEGLAWHARTIAPARVTDLPVVAARFDADVGATEIMTFAPDRRGMFSIVTGALGDLNLSVVDARIHGTRDHFVLDHFVVLDQEGNPIRDARQLKDLAVLLQKALLENRTARDRPPARLPRQLKHFPVETRVRIGASPGGGRTIVEVVAQDRPGLLHQIALALLTCEVRMVGAKVTTFGERAEDIFYVTMQDGKPVTDAETIATLEREIARRLAV